MNNIEKYYCDLLGNPYVKYLHNKIKNLENIIVHLKEEYVLLENASSEYEDGLENKIENLENKINNLRQSICDFLCTEDYISLNGEAIANHYQELLVNLGDTNDG